MYTHTYMPIKNSYSVHTYTHIHIYTYIRVYVCVYDQELPQHSRVLISATPAFCNAQILAQFSPTNILHQVHTSTHTHSFVLFLTHCCLISLSFSLSLCFCFWLSRVRIPYDRDGFSLQSLLVSHSDARAHTRARTRAFSEHARPYSICACLSHFHCLSCF